LRILTCSKDKFHLKFYTPEIHQIQELKFLGTNSNDRGTPFSSFYPEISLFVARLQARRKRRKTPKNPQFPKNRRINAIFSVRLETLGKQRKFRSTQNSGPGNRGKTLSEGQNIDTAGGTQQPPRAQPNLNSNLYREIQRNLNLSIWWISGMLHFQWKASYLRPKADESHALND